MVSRQIRGSPPTLISSRTLKLAETELGCSVAHLALAWIAKNPNTSTVILGASKPEQVVDNLKALDVIPKLTPEIFDKIEMILQNKPAPAVSDGVGNLIGLRMLIVTALSAYLWQATT